MSRQTDVADDAIQEAQANTQYHWAPTPGGLYLWTRNECPIGDVGRRDDTAMNCFAYPMLLAVRRGYLTRDQAARILGDTRRSGDKAAYAFSGSWVTQLWVDRPGVPGDYWRPRKGDLIFFEGIIGGFLAHVALATGGTGAANKGNQCVSFGEGRTTMGQATVNVTTIEALSHGYRSVRFLSPAWG